ncbi:hypothetical protein BRC80_00505 [Halobacteriales archaeon QH_9_66_26]|nr:MAG: hypothetical protein BRC80_00505 [Halobacteriales archaeon QH_9_66_26]
MAHNDPYEWSMEQHDPAGIGHRVRQSNEINCTVGGSFEISCAPSATADRSKTERALQDLNRVETVRSLRSRLCLSGFKSFGFHSSLLTAVHRTSGRCRI